MTADVFDRVRACGIVPVVTVASAQSAVGLARALLAGGIDVIEVTLRTPAALSAIAAVAEEVPDVLIAAGTVIEPRAVTAVAAAGAQFCVSPGFDPRLSRACREAALPYLPGGVTATEIQACLAAGHKLVKFFPAGTSGGVAAMRALAAPFASHSLGFVPTGAIGAADVPSYLAFEPVAAVGGSWLTPPHDVDVGAWEAIARRAAEARAMVDAARGTPAGSTTS